MGIIVINGPRGPLAFQDRGVTGVGAPRYFGRTYQARGYQGFSEPTVVGARYFPPEPDFDENDVEVPIATGDIWTGGREIYREKVYQQAKKVGKTHGLKPSQIDDIKPKRVT